MLKRNKKLTTLALALAMLLGLATFAGAEVQETEKARCTIEETTQKELDDNYSQGQTVLLINTGNNVVKNAQETKYPTKITIDFSKSPIERSNNALVTIEGSEWTAQEEMLCVTEKYDSGLFTVLDGVMSLDGEKCDVVIALTYGDANNIFATITISYPDNDVSEAYCLGDYTDTVKKICLEKRAAEAEKNSTSEEAPEGERVNGTIAYQSHQNVYQSSYNTATVSLYHAAELSNQGTTYIYVKVNAHAANFKSYAQNSLGLNGDNTILSVAPDNLTSSITGVGNFKIHNNSWSPASGETDYNVSVLLYLPVIGLINFNQSYAVSSSVVTISSTSASSHNNRINWAISKTNGFTNLEGNFNTTGGGMCECGYTYADDVSSPLSKSINATGRLRYKCTYVVLPDNGYEEGDVYYYYYWTPTGSCNGNITIVP